MEILAIYGVGAASASLSPLGQHNQVSFSLHEAECVEIRLQIQDRAASQIAFPQAPDVECHEDSIRMGFHGRHNFAEHLGREPLRVRDVLPRPRLIPPAEVSSGRAPSKNASRFAAVLLMSATDRFSSAVIAGALYGSKFRASGAPRLYRSPACEIAVDSILQLRATLA